MKRVVVTGLGVVSPIGNDIPSFKSNLKKAVTGEGPITRFDAAPDFPDKKVFEVKEFRPPKSSKILDPFIQYALSAVDQALDDAGLNLQDKDPFSVGLVMSSSKGGFTSYQRDIENFKVRRSALVAAKIYSSFLPNMASQWIARQKGIKGPAVCYVAACTTGTYSISEAAEMIRRGEVGVCIAGATEAPLCDLLLAAYDQMDVYSKEKMRPFDKERAGFQLGEGAGCLVLESLEHALERDAHIYAEIGSHTYGEDLHNLIGFDSESNSLERVLRKNLERASITAEEISYINSHGTATRLGDSYEINQLRNVFGDNLKKIPISATKSMTGHMLGASGAIEIIATILGIKDSFLPPTAALNEADEEFKDLDLVPNKARDCKIKNAITYSLGFGGHIASLILKRWV